MNMNQSQITSPGTETLFRLQSSRKEVFAFAAESCNVTCIPNIPFILLIQLVIRLLYLLLFKSKSRIRILDSNLHSGNLPRATSRH